jgi:CheY-like chemotaxis protein
MSLKYKPMKILVVDDDLSNRMLLKVFLMRKGHTVLQAENGQVALEIFEQEHPDMILMDVTMPVMTGYEASSIIKQRSGKRFVPIIFLTGLTDDESLAKCVESGGDDFLGKPFNSTLIGAKIAAMQRILQMHQELEIYRNRTEEEIELSHHVFNSVTSRTSVNEIPGLNHWLLSAGHFSGDLLLFDKSPSGKLYLMLGDFTGHGFSAAIGALPTSDVFFALTHRDFKPADILSEINRKLHLIMPPGQFCAMAFICVDSAKRKIDIFNAGLPAVLLLDQKGSVQHAFKSDHLALGVLSAGTFTVEMMTLDYVSGNTLVLYSDGLTESQNEAGEMFGDERLIAALSGGEKPFESVKAGLVDYIGNAPPDDDISLITLTL